VLRAFRVHEPARPIPGGQGTSWRAGNLVLKPGTDGAVHDWLCDLLAELVADGLRVARPVPTREGAWSCRGWSATRWVDGVEPRGGETATWVAVVEAGRTLHRALAHVPRPDCLDAPEDPWALADRAAWGEREPRLPVELSGLLPGLQAALTPLGPAQLVHGDLTTNVLFAAGSAPAVLDVSPYWRPPAYAEGVVVADALCWHGARVDLLDRAQVPVGAVARALLFRMATTAERVRTPASGAVDLRDEARRYARAATAIGG